MPTKSNPIGEGKYLDLEKPWVSWFQLILDAGYVLRPRYRPGWVRPWTDGALLTDQEEAIIPMRPNVLDARRISDGAPVWLKSAPKNSPELEITKLLTSNGLEKDPRNHTAPVWDVIEIPGDLEHVILVSPLLRRVDMPEPASVRECVDFVQQTLEGLTFMHEHHVAHRDCNWENIMMDGSNLFPDGWHPQSWWRLPDGEGMDLNFSPSRTGTGGVRYYFIDFGISTHNQSQTIGLNGQVRAPELSEDIPYDPYKLDVFILGTAYKNFIVEPRPGTRFLRPLIDYMTAENPRDRPSAVEALKKFQSIRTTVSEGDLARRIPPTHPEGPVTRWMNDVHYRLRELWWGLNPKAPPRPLT